MDVLSRMTWPMRHQPIERLQTGFSMGTLGRLIMFEDNFYFQYI